MNRISLRIFIIFFFIGFSFHQSFAANCSNDLKLIFDDGDEQCLSDFPELFTIHKLNQNKFDLDFFKKKKTVSLASNGNQCGNDFGIAWEFATPNANDKEAIEACQRFSVNKNCKCEILLSADAPIGAAKVKIPKIDFISKYKNKNIDYTVVTAEKKEFPSNKAAADTTANSLDQCLKDDSKCYGGLTRTTVGEPKIGDIYKTTIPISNKIEITIPDGLWQVVENTNFKVEPSWHAPWHILSLKNLDKNSPFKFVFYDYFKLPSKWNGWEVPCDAPQKFAGISVIQNKKAGLTQQCVYAFYWNNPKASFRSLKTHKYWENEIKNYDENFINSLPSSGISFESVIYRFNSVYIREVFLLDHLAIYINGHKFIRNDFTSKSFNKKTLEVDEEKLYDWLLNYSENRVKTFFDKSNSDIQLAKFPFTRSVPNETEIKEASSKDESLKNQLLNQVESQDVAVKEPLTSDAVAKEIALREAAAKDAAAKELALKEAAAKEAAAKESALKEAAAREAAAKELALKEAATKEAATSIKKALVIGNDSYENVSKLKNARSDANAMGLALKAVGYKVQVKTDLNHKEMKKVLRQFKMGVEPGDEVVIFFAGHGLQIAGSNYLLPIDITAESEDQIKDDAIQLQRLLDDMNDQKARLTLALIDACRDNPFPKSGRALGGRGLAPTSAATGQMIIFSAGVGQQALDRLGSSDNDPNSVFTRIFIKEIKKPGVRIDNVIREVRKKVVEAAKTVGHDQVPAIYDQVVGDFYFIK